jgi:magnesium-transporting ATPase (P-type)
VTAVSGRDTQDPATGTNTKGLWEPRCEEINSGIPVPTRLLDRSKDEQDAIQWGPVPPRCLTECGRPVDEERMPDPTPQSPEAEGPGPSWFAMSAEEVAGRLGVVPQEGLDSLEVAARLERYGPNVLEEERPKPAWRRFLEQYTSSMQIVLVLAAVVSLLIAEYRTFLLLVALTLFSAAVGYRQEAKAGASVTALNRMMKVVAKVRRDGGITRVEADQVVPGDIVILDAGDRVPADGRVIAAATLQVDEAVLTGESTAVEKTAGVIPTPDPPLGDRLNMATGGKSETPITS